MLQTNARDTAIAHLAEALLLIQAGQAPLVLGVMGAPAAVTVAPEAHMRPMRPVGCPHGACYQF